MPYSNHSDRLQRFSKTMAMLTTLGILLIAVAMILVFLIPDWTRNLLLARLGRAGHDLSLSPGHLIAAAAVTAVPVGVLLFGLRRPSSDRSRRRRCCSPSH
jgi:hypothetical protein